MTQPPTPIQIGFSPCPNDTFIFDALINQKIDTQGLVFEPFIADVEELNLQAQQGNLHITKLSYHAFASVLDTYELLHSGSALGRNCGPLLIARQKMDSHEIDNATIAIPGKNTTANLLLSIAYPEARHKKEMLFSQIENTVLTKQADCGLIIHESRFTYQQKGLVKICDLGEFWETHTRLPIPLGGIAIRRSLPQHLKIKINQLLRQSVEYALANPAQALPYVRQYAQEMDEKVIMSHIQLYVNDFTVDLGQDGRQAIQYLFEKAENMKIISNFKKNILVAL